MDRTPVILMSLVESFNCCSIWHKPVRRNHDRSWQPQFGAREAWASVTTGKHSFDIPILLSLFLPLVAVPTMTDLARIARPWLFSPRSPVRTPSVILSLHLGLGYRHSISTTAACRNKRLANQTSIQRRRKAREAETETMASTFLLPSRPSQTDTIVPPPIHRFPRNPVDFARAAWLIARNRVVALGGLLSVYLISMPAAFGWPRFRSRRRTCVPAAKTLHVEMSEAVASGDKETLRRVCKNSFYQTLAGAIDSRTPGTRTEWELVRYEHPLRYPRLADFRVASQPLPGGGSRIVKQAVVSIASVQRLARYDMLKGGGKVPGSERERKMVEHVVLQAQVNDVTFESEPWKVWGTLQETPYETMRRDQLLYDEITAPGQRS
ncbi:hypothetical protein F4861DRAFT_306190 [Xylaria intraflava]|nr:hypothetical protein F4861DRAFT_306190 [Xylaria intraflava]